MKFGGGHISLGYMCGTLAKMCSRDVIMRKQVTPPVDESTRSGHGDVKAVNGKQKQAGPALEQDMTTKCNDGIQDWKKIMGYHS